MYLLDTTVVSHAVNSKSPKHLAVHNFFDSNALYQDQIYICPITISETRFGLNLLKERVPPPDPAIIAEIEQRVLDIAKTWEILPIDHHVARHHADLRIAYAKLKLPKLVATGSKKMKAKHVELWHEEVPASSLQITENDLWIAATALNYNLILVSTDTDHENLRLAYPDLYLQLI